MPSQDELDEQYAGSDTENRLRRLESAVNSLMTSGLERLTESGLVQFDGIPIRWNTNGMQVKLPGGGTSRGAYYFVKNFWDSEDTNGRFRGDPQVELSAAYNGATNVFFRDATYLTRDASLSGPEALIQRTANEAYAEILLSCDFTQDGDGAELRVKEDSSGVKTYQLHMGSGVYADIATGVGMTPVVKAADETVNGSATLQNDDELLFAVAANTSYQFEGVLTVSTGATPDIQIAFTGPSGATGSYSVEFITTATSISFDSDTLGNAVTFDAAQSIQTVRFWGAIANGSNAGNCTLQWAQRSSNASDTIVRAGSYLKYQAEA